MNFDLSPYAIAVIIPAYRVEKQIMTVLQTIPQFVRWIIVIDDCSPDSTSKIVAERQQQDPRIILLQHTENLGVGGAMITGYKHAISLGVDMIVKMDGDGQMSAEDLPSLLVPLVKQADFAKGNRFRDFNALKAMPPIRRLGNMILGFLVKAATGYWNCFDPTNGYIAMRREVLIQLPLEQIHKRYFFEISQLCHLYLVGAFIVDVPMPARYADEKSNLSIRQTLLEFPPLLLQAFLRRIILRHFVFDFSMFAIFLLTGLPLVLFALAFGLNRWAYYGSLGIPAPTGTVMLPTLSMLVGIQLLLSAINLDQVATPKVPLSPPLRNSLD